MAPTAMHLRDYPGSGSGWYGSGGGVVRAGVAAGVDASRRIVIALRAGFDSSERLNMTPGLPFYAFVGGGARF